MQSGSPTIHLELLVLGKPRGSKSTPNPAIYQKVELILVENATLIYYKYDY